MARMSVNCLHNQTNMIEIMTKEHLVLASSVSSLTGKIRRIGRIILFGFQTPDDNILSTHPPHDKTSPANIYDSQKLQVFCYWGNEW